MNEEDRIRKEFKKLKRTRHHDDRFMTLARRWKRPIREIKRIVGWEPHAQRYPYRVGVLLRDGTWVMSGYRKEDAAWRYAQQLETGGVSFYNNHVFDFAWVFDRSGKPLAYDRKPDDIYLRGAWVRLKVSGLSS